MAPVHRTIWLVTALAVWLAGCGDDNIVAGPDRPEPKAPAFFAIVSNAVGVAAASGAGLPAAAEAEVAYISLPPGTIPEGEVATIANRRTGATVTTPVTEGGFDPVPVAAQTGDTLQVEVRVAGASAAVRGVFVVPGRRRPIVVRTDPPPRKRDVPLNASLVIVFSEPVDPATLSPTSVRLLSDGTSVEGTVGVVPGSPWIVAFTPTSPLEPDTEYEIVVTQEVRDLDGEPLDLAILVPFRTSNDVVAPELDQIVAGGHHSCSLDPSRGQAYCWGDNSSGQLGAGSTASEASVVWVVGNWGFGKLVAGDAHTCGLTGPPGAAYCWGRNGSGQLGDGTTTNRPGPRAVSGGLSFTAIAAGGSHTCGLTGDGVAYCWGANDESQLGDGSPPGSYGYGRFSPVPVLVLGGHRFTRLVGGGSHTCGLSNSGAAYCWGANNDGQLGIGSPKFSTTPAAVSGGLSFSALAAGVRHTCGLARSGAAYCWGANNDGGQLGDGSIISKSTPVAVTGGRSFTALAAGGFHTCGLSGPGVAFCWGVNGDGQLGNSSITNSSGPVAVSGGIGFIALAVGISHTCGFAKSGVFLCWGNNEVGQVRPQIVSGTSPTWAPVAVKSVWDY